MIKIMFVCLGNICRSPMAEFVMKDIVKKEKCEKEFYIASSAVSTEALGCKVHYGTRNKLNSVGISVDGKYAVQLKKSDYDEYDYIIGMDSSNIEGIHRIIGKDTKNKVYKLMEFAGSFSDIADPWYTGDFNKTYDDIIKGCNALYKKLI